MAVLGRCRGAVPENTDCAEEGLATNPAAEAGRPRPSLPPPEDDPSRCEAVSAKCTPVLENPGSYRFSRADDGRGKFSADAGLLEAPPAIADAGRAAEALPRRSGRVPKAVLGLCDGRFCVELDAGPSDIPAERPPPPEVLRTFETEPRNLQVKILKNPRTKTEVVSFDHLPFVRRTSWS